MQCNKIQLLLPLFIGEDRMSDRSRIHEHSFKTVSKLTNSYRFSNTLTHV